MWIIFLQIFPSRIFFCKLFFLHLFCKLSFPTTFCKLLLWILSCKLCKLLLFCTTSFANICSGQFSCKCYCGPIILQNLQSFCCVSVFANALINFYVNCCSGHFCANFAYCSRQTFKKLLFVIPDQLFANGCSRQLFFAPSGSRQIVRVKLIRVVRMVMVFQWDRLVQVGQVVQMI